MFKIVVLEYSRSPAWWLDCVLNGEAMDEHRAAMLAVGRPCVFGEGAKIFAKPEEAKMKIQLFGISVEQIILEAGFCEPPGLDSQAPCFCF